MMHLNLLAYFERIFAMKQYHGWTISEMEDMLPWELDAMTSLLSNYLEQREMQRKQREVNL